MNSSITTPICLLAVILSLLAAPAHSDSDPATTARDTSADVARAREWLRTVRMSGRDRLVAESPPPFPSRVFVDKQAVQWPTGQAQCAVLGGDQAHPEGMNKREQDLNRPIIECRKVLILVIETQVHGEIISRGIELLPDIPLALPEPAPSLEEHRNNYLTKLFNQRPFTLTAMYDTYFVRGIIRKMRDEPPVHDEAALEAALRRIDERIDCADFDLAFALRYYRLGAGTEQDRRRIRESALKFRYWRDDPGNDGMVFHSENHALLFHSDELIAGNLWPDDTFTNTGLKGQEHARLGRQRCLEWLDRIEAQGYEEFLSTTYVPITVGALLNLVDFSDDAGISRRAARQVDKIFKMMAEHSFDGVMMGAQARTSRRMLYPQVLTTQALMSYATPRAVEAFDPWSIFVASSPHYRLPSEIDGLMASPISKQYREERFLINLNKTREYMLSSIEIPAEHSSNTRTPISGQRGYQQHTWSAVLARDCHVFTTHPGSTADRGDGTPGFWTGNATLPRQTQRGNMLLQIFSFPKDHPVQFTHAHWPTRAFDTELIRGHWAFGRKNKGYVGLWCSTKPVLCGEILIDGELRAAGNKTAWICVCSGESESGDFDAFIQSCEKLHPKFDQQARVLYVDGQRSMSWDEAQ